MKTKLLQKNKEISFGDTIKGISKKISSILTAIMITLTCSMTAFAAEGDGSGTTTDGSDIWWWLEKSLKDVYGKFLGISTIAACLACSICLLLMTFSTDDRAVSSSRSWLKRIAICWIILNVLGYIMAYLVTLTSGGNYTA